MKRYYLRILTLISMLTLGSWLLVGSSLPQDVTAQGADLNTTLARAAARGFFSSLTFDVSNRADLASFYLNSELATDAQVNDLLNQELIGYSLFGGQWLDSATYQISARLNPGGEQVIVQVQKVNSRWRIVNLIRGRSTSTDTANTNETSAGSTTGTTTNATTATGAISGASSGEPVMVYAQAEVLAPGLNIRGGPSLDYGVLQTLNQDDVVDVTGISGLGTWYRVAQNGQVIGWMSTRSDLVSVSPDDAEIPIVLAGATVGTGTTTETSTTSAVTSASTPRTAGAEIMILQPQSGAEFYAINPDGTGLRLLTSGVDPVLSPDGSKVAFTRWDSGQIGSLWLYDLNTNQEKFIAGDIQYEPKSPTWSPDGSEIMVNFQYGGRRFVEAFCKDPGSRIPPNATDINIGSETGRICYKIPADTYWKLRKINVATGAWEDMSSPRYSYGPTWDPANPWRVVFTGERGLLQIDVNRNEHFPFGQPDWRDHAPVFSPDGSQLAVTYRQDNFWEVYTIDVATGARNRLTKPPLLRNRYSSAAPAWSPNGSQLVFITDRQGEWEFWIMNADGSNQRPLLAPEVAGQLGEVQYSGVDERLISWK